MLGRWLEAKPPHWTAALASASALRSFLSRIPLPGGPGNYSAGAHTHMPLTYTCIHSFSHMHACSHTSTRLTHTHIHLHTCTHTYTLMLTHTLACSHPLAHTNACPPELTGGGLSGGGGQHLVSPALRLKSAHIGPADVPGSLGPASASEGGMCS